MLLLLLWFNFVLTLNLIFPFGITIHDKMFETQENETKIKDYNWLNNLITIYFLPGRVSHLHYS